MNITIVTGADAVESALDIFFLFFFFLFHIVESTSLHAAFVARFFESRALDRFLRISGKWFEATVLLNIRYSNILENVLS